MNNTLVWVSTGPAYASSACHNTASVYKSGMKIAAILIPNDNISPMQTADSG